MAHVASREEIYWAILGSTARTCYRSNCSESDGGAQRARILRLEVAWNRDISRPEHVIGRTGGIPTATKTTRVSL